ncbi:hypothetical protein JB92DRAFT_2937756 [Gautieria morchelliformis]|nr:hypothetical protein JB92DRAFT_2937756 [Gautieria morchelliformis]
MSNLIEPSLVASQMISSSSFIIGGDNISKLFRTLLKHLHQLRPSIGNLPPGMHTLPHNGRCNTHTRSYSTPNVTVNPRNRKNSSTAHQLLCINTHNLHLAAPPVVDLTRLDSPSLASFTPYSESIDSQGPAQGSLRAHIHVRSQSLLSIPQSATILDPDTGIAGIAMPTSRQRLHRFSLFEFSSTAGYPPTSPTLNQEEKGNSCSSSPPSSPSLSIPSISRTHSTTASSSLPRTPPLPLSPLSARRNSKLPGKKMNPETLPGFRGRKRTPSLPMPPTHRKRDPSPSRNRVRERTFSGFDPNYTSWLDRLDSRTRSRSPACTPHTPHSTPPSSPLSLTALESSSKFMRTVAICDVCGASGADFPRCPARGCGSAWCSRACRMAARKEAGAGETGIRGHGCKGKRAGGY